METKQADGSRMEKVVLPPGYSPTCLKFLVTQGNQLSRRAPPLSYHKPRRGLSNGARAFKKKNKTPPKLPFLKSRERKREFGFLAGALAPSRGKGGCANPGLSGRHGGIFRTDGGRKEREFTLKFISEDRLPHLLFYGPPGTGKTSTILACAKQLYKGKEFSSMVLELNASDDRGIEIVRGPILSFASTRTIFKCHGFKMVILDEADAMTQEAQNALRRVIEKFTENTRFCLICNYLSKIIPALQSRCTRFRFGPLTPDLMVPRLQYVIEKENVDITDDGMKALVTLSNGDMRRSLNILQSTNMAFGKVTEETVYTCTGQPLKSDIANILDWMLNQDFTTAYRNIMELKTLKGLALHDILTEIHTFVHRVDFPSSIRIQLLIKLADVE
ncbi:hypothetical protein JRQ81_007690 [Phrynocephalus forsythii]|uniref:Activator 1 subunit 5 n=1 Tax=Phrynocephalus forsythii TaxID=171643 RepID=A0A9Q1ATL9_9SAUR|nr:hypothetical protein JRQ81_007690 [Phrynocephalus forsythii]